MQNCISIFYIDRRLDCKLVWYSTYTESHAISTLIYEDTYMYLPNFKIMQHWMKPYAEEISQLSNQKSLHQDFFSKVPKYYLIYFASNKNECVKTFSVVRYKKQGRFFVFRHNVEKLYKTYT